MTWRGKLFFHPENTDEIEQDAFTCSSCRKPLDSSSASDQGSPDWKIVEAVVSMRESGSSLDDVLRLVQLGWQREVN